MVDSSEFDCKRTKFESNLKQNLFVDKNDVMVTVNHTYAKDATKSHSNRILSSDQYRELIYNNNGSSAFNVWYATQIFLDVHLTNLLVEKFQSVNELLINIIFIVLPCISRTLVTFNGYHLAFSLVEFAAILVLRRLPNDHFVRKKSEPYRKRSSLLTVLRSSLFLITSIAILAVDFRIFHLPFAKTDRYGYSLMDTGVGLFALINGSSHRQSKLSSIGCLLVIGVSRLCAITITGYHFNVTEYGIHWNFFLTIFVLKIALNYVTVQRPLLMSATVAILYELALHWFDWKRMIFDRDSSRETFLSANREGIYTLPGYLSLYLFGIYVRSLLETENRFWKFTLVSIVSLTLHLLLLWFCPDGALQPSRKLANLTYYLWIVFICCSIASLLLLPILASGDNVLEVPLVFKTINSNSLGYFLAANLLTGAINLLTDTLAVLNPLVSFAIVFLYSLVLIGVFYYFRPREIKSD